MKISIQIFDLYLNRANNFTSYYKQQLECNALIKRKTNEVQALRRASSISSLQSSSRIVKSNAVVPHTGPGDYNGTAAVLVYWHTSSISAAPISAESPVKTRDGPHIVRNRSKTGRRSGGRHKNKVISSNEGAEVVLE